MSWIRRREIPIWMTGIIGFMMLFEYYVNIPILSTITSYIVGWVTIIAAFALGVGLWGLMLHYGRQIKSRKAGEWYFGVWWFILFISMSSIGLTLGASSAPYQWMFLNLLRSVWSAVAATTAFFIVTAAFRAFRVRTWEATVMLVASAFIMLLNAPIGAVISPIFPQVGNWIMMVPNVGARRGLIIGMGIAGLALGLRAFLGYERSYLGEAA